MRRVTCVELSVFERITPLASAYLEAYAGGSDIAGEYAFEKYTTSIKTPANTIAREVLSTGADVYAFSCYVWNMGLVRPLVGLIREAQPNARIMLGGPQVMHHAERYLDPTDENVALCNGEGEATFTAYLRELLSDAPDLSRVEGISFCRDGRVVTNVERPRITDLDTIPSPFLTGVLDGQFSMSILETNRGCPYHCGFCYWGAATNDRVYRFDEERIRDEISWMADHEILFLYLADANWGMLARDVDLSEHIADHARRDGVPRVVYFSSAKNKPHAVTRITGIFQDAGLVTSQPISMQTLEPRSLDIITRSNIKLSAFAAIQEDLQKRKLSSYIELIWPLPGETLESFRRGIGTLCETGAQTVIVYSHLLLHNTPIYHNAERLGLVTRPAGGGIAEAQIVVETEDVDYADFVAGMRYFYALHAVHNTNALHAVCRYLQATGRASHRDVFVAFADFMASSPAGAVFDEFVRESIDDARYYDINNYGLFIHMVLHSERRAFDALLREFVTSQPWWDDPTVRFLFEIDLVNLPYVYSNTPLDELDYPFASVEVVERGRRSVTVRIDERWHGELDGAVRLERSSPDGDVFVVDHNRQQYPYMVSQSLDHNAGYCHGMIEKVENILPVWRSA